MSMYSSMPPEELIRACIDSGVADAWLEFVRRFRRVIAGTALRMARHWIEPSREAIEDLVQEIYVKLCADDYKLLREFQPDYPDAIFGFLKSVTANVVRDHFKAANAEKRGAGQPNVPLSEVELAGSDDIPGCRAELDRRVLLSEINQYLNECAPGPENQKIRTIFFLYYQQGLSASEIAAIRSMGLRTKGVESVILRLTRLLRDRVMALSEAEAKRKSTCE